MDNKVFVTVGSTSFDELISTVCSDEVMEALESKGYKNITLQIGRGLYEPDKSLKNVEWYRYKDDVMEDVETSSLVISHAGAGSILQALELGKPLLVVINDKLMNNHQEELAKELYEAQYINYCYCSNLSETIANLNVKSLKPYSRSDPLKFVNFLDQIMGYE